MHLARSLSLTLATFLVATATAAPVLSRQKLVLETLARRAAEPQNNSEECDEVTQQLYEVMAIITGEDWPSMNSVCFVLLFFSLVFSPVALRISGSCSYAPLDFRCNCPRFQGFLRDRSLFLTDGVSIAEHYSNAGGGAGCNC
jgi:hypothetical protein